MVLLKTMISRNRKARRMAKEAGNAASFVSKARNHCGGGTEETAGTAGRNPILPERGFSHIGRASPS